MKRKDISEQIKVALWQENSAKPSWKGLKLSNRLLKEKKNEVSRKT